MVIFKDEFCGHTEINSKIASTFKSLVVGSKEILSTDT